MNTNTNLAIQEVAHCLKFQPSAFLKPNTVKGMHFKVQIRKKMVAETDN